MKAAFNFEFDDIDVAVPLGGRLQHPAGLKTGHYMLCPVLAATGGTEAFVLPTKWPVHVDAGRVQAQPHSPLCEISRSIINPACLGIGTR